MQVSDYRAFGAAPSQIVSTGSFVAGQGESLLVVVLAATVLSAVNVRFPKPQVVLGAGSSATAVNPAPGVDAAVTLATGQQVVSLSSLTVDSGLCQIFWFKI